VSDRSFRLANTRKCAADTCWLIIKLSDAKLFGTV